MYQSMVQSTKEVDGEFFETEKEVIDSRGRFQIGHSKQSHTLSLQIAHVKDNYYLCDSPGFFDNRGAEIEIFNASSLKQFMLNCKTVRVVVLISYHELLAQRGALFQEVYKLVSRILKYPEQEAFEKMIFLFTKVPKEKKISNIQSEIIDFYEILAQNENFESQRTKIFLKAILNQLKANNLVIVNPIDKQHEYLLQKIIYQPAFTQPSEEFCFSISEHANQKLYLYVEMISNNIIEFQSKGLYKEIMEVMAEFKQVRDCTGDQYLLDSYDDLSREIVKKFEKQKNYTFNIFNEAAEKNNLFSSQNIKEILEIIQYLRIIDQHKDEIFEEGQFTASENEFKQQIEGVCFLMSQRITKDFPKNMENVKINLQKLKGFSEQTSLGQTFFDQSLKEIQEKYRQEILILNELSEQFYKRPSQLDFNAIKSSLSQITQKIEFFNQINEFLRGFILDQTDNNYQVLVQFQLKNNQELVKNVKIIISSYHEEIKKQPSFDDSHIAFDPKIQSLPAFEIYVLKIQNQNIKYAEYIPECENLYNQALSCLKEFNTQVFNIIKENTEDEFHLYKLKNILTILDEIRSLDDFIQDKTAEEYKQIKDEIKQKIKQKSVEAKKILNKYEEEIQEESNGEEDEDDLKSIKSFEGSQQNFQTNLKKDFNKLKKIYMFLCDMHWADEYFQIKLTQHTITKLNAKLNNYLEFCKMNIQNFLEQDKFYQIKYFLQKMNNLSIFKDILTNFQDQYQECIDQVRKQVNEKNIQINEFISIIQREDTKFNNYPWKSLNQHILYLQKTQNLEMIADVKRNSIFSLENITCVIQAYFEKNFSQIQMLTKELACSQKVDFQKFSEFIKNAKLVYQEYQSIEQLLKKYSLKQLTDLIQKVYEELVFDYHQKKEDIVVNLQEIQASYDTIKTFVDSIDEFDILKQQFKSLSKPQETIQEIQKKLENFLKIEDFQGIEKEIKLLSQLKSDKDRQALNNIYQTLYDKLDNEIKQMHFLFNLKKSGNLDLESIRQNLKRISRILKVLSNYQTELYQRSQNDLDKFILEFSQNYMKYQKQIIMNKLKTHKFNELQKAYDEFILSIDCLSEFREIFKQSEWNTFVIQERENINEDIKKTILHLHEPTSELKYLQNLLNILNQAQQLHSNFQDTFQHEAQNTINKIQSVFNSCEEDIKIKIKNQDFRFKNEIKILKDFAQREENHEHYDFLMRINQLEDQINEESTQKYQEIQRYLAKKEPKKAIKLIKEIKNVDVQYFDKLIKKIENDINISISQIKEQFPQMDTTNFQKNIQTALSHMEIIDHFTNQQTQHKHTTEISILINFIFTQSSKLFSECEQILSSDEQSFQTQNLKNLFNHHSFLQVIQKELVETQQSKQLQDEFFNTLVQIKEGLEKVHLSQKLITEKIQVDKSLNMRYKKFSALLSLINKDSSFFNQSDELKKIKEIGQKIMNQGELYQQIKANFKREEQAFRAALEDCDFQRVKSTLFNLKKYCDIHQQYDTEFFDMSLFLNQLRQKIDQITQEAIEKVKANLKYDEDLNKIINSIYKADEHLKGIDQFPYEPLLPKVLKELDLKLDQDIQNFENSASIHYQNIPEVCQFLIKIQEISYKVNKFGQIIDQKLDKIVNRLKICLGEDIIFQLGAKLKEDAYGAQIVNKIPSFLSLKTEKFNELVGKHDINYVLHKIQHSVKGSNKQNLDDKLKKKLKEYYDIYLQKYEEIIKIYQFNKNEWIGIIAQAKLISNTVNLPKKEWEDKNQVLFLLAHVCAYWTLVNSEEQKQGARVVLKRPNHTQIISIIMLLGIHRESGFWQGIKNYIKQNEQAKFRNQLIEILTGEGKSLTLGFCSTILALLGCDVDMVCYSKYLSERDDKDFRNLFVSFGVSEKISYGTFDQQAEKYLESYLNVRQSTLSVIKQGVQNQGINQKKNISNHRILLIDEVDIFFNMDFYGKTYNPVVSFVTEEIKNIITDIWKQKGQKEQNIVQNITQRNQSYKKLIGQYSNFEKLFQRHIQLLAQDVNTVEQHKQTHKYVVRDNKIGYRKPDSTISFSTSFGYSTTFAYFHENSIGNISDYALQQYISLQLYCGHVSYALIPETYSAILGVTGTLQSLNQQMKQCLQKYNISTEVYIPSMFGDSKLDFKEGYMVKVETDQQNQYLQIQEISKQAIINKQSVLIFFKDIQSLHNYYQSNYLFLQKEKYLVVTDNENGDDFNLQIEKVTFSGEIGLFVREYGRGTNFVSLDSRVNKAGGVIVIQTFLSDEKVEEIQIKGRTARQGESGKYYLILNEQDLIKDFQLKKDQIHMWKNNQGLYAKLNQHRNQKEDDKYKNIENSIKQATNSHNESIKYYENLKSQNFKEAIKYINDNS
ncbi:hypothetical protein ABPG72_017511 [Tetrahymena utriculariae]